MYAAFINGIAVALAAVIGVLFKNKINEKYTTAMIAGLAIIVGLMGVTYAVDTNDTLGMIICVVIGIFIGEILKIEQRIEAVGERLKKIVEKDKSNSSFTQGFVAASVLFCVGPMAILGSLQAGTTGDATIILSKTVIDCITAVSFAMAMGIGVAFSGLSIILYQGLITLLAIWIAPYLGDAVITEITAVGGVLMVGIAINLLGLKKEKIRVGNMLPALFLPIFYQPFVLWLTGLF